MDPGNARASFGQLLRQLYRRAVRLFQRFIGQGHGGRRKARHPAAGQMRRHADESLFVAVGKIGAGRAVRMYVDKTGQHVSTLQVLAAFLYIRKKGAEAPLFYIESAEAESFSVKYISVDKTHLKPPEDWPRQCSGPLFLPSHQAASRRSFH